MVVIYKEKYSVIFSFCLNTQSVAVCRKKMLLVSFHADSFPLCLLGVRESSDINLYKFIQHSCKILWRNSWLANLSQPANRFCDDDNDGIKIRLSSTIIGLESVATRLSGERVLAATEHLFNHRDYTSHNYISALPGNSAVRYMLIAIMLNYLIYNVLCKSSWFFLFPSCFTLCTQEFTQAWDQTCIPGTPQVCVNVSRNVFRGTSINKIDTALKLSLSFIRLLHSIEPHPWEFLVCKAKHEFSIWNIDTSNGYIIQSGA